MTKTTTQTVIAGLFLVAMTTTAGAQRSVKLMTEVSEVRIDDVVVANSVRVPEGSAVVYTSPFGNSVSLNIRNGTAAGMEVVAANGRRIPGQRVSSQMAQVLAADKVAQRLATKKEKWDKQATWVCVSLLESPSAACYRLDVDPRLPLPPTGPEELVRRPAPALQ